MKSRVVGHDQLMALIDHTSAVIPDGLTAEGDRNLIRTRHGGRITAEGTPGRSAVFRFRLTPETQ